jgi:predicted phosphodiesterase
MELNKVLQSIWQHLINWWQALKSLFGSKQSAELIELLTRAHQQAEQAMESGSVRLPNEVPWELVHGLEKLGLLGALNPLPKTSEEFSTIVRTDGTLLGTRQWELLDPRWVEALLKWLEYFDKRAPFVNTPALITIPNEAVIAIVGDWGTGPFQPNAPSTKVAQQVSAGNPDYTIHLGDVYYAGTNEEEQNAMQGWPQGRLGSFTLNSNHEMYSGGIGYFNELKRNFPLQKGTSYFALQNDNWLIIGLDSAYYADKLNLYMDGNLGNEQLAWLSKLPKNKKLMVLSHHEAYSALGKNQTALYRQVAGALGKDPDYWYWGHLHNGIVYKTIGNFHGRCVGHGAIPYGNATELSGDDSVVWYETESANDPNYPERVLNGYAVIELKGDHLTEQLKDENGRQRWAAI